MGKDRKGLRILEGFRHSFPDSPRTRANDYRRPHRKKGSSHSHVLKPKRENRVSALTAMEQRLGSLLEDRSRIGQDLHDCIRQSLDVIGVNLQTARRMGSPHTAETDRSHAGIAGQINRLVCEIQQMIQGLNGGVVQEFDLTAKLYALKSIYDEIGHVQITLDLQPAAIEVLTREEEREILNIVREALRNCVRHTHAAHATISIRRRGARIQVHISDDGKGFAVGDGRSRGYGLVNIESRARKIGGILRIQSEEGRGTQVTVVFSLEPLLTPV